MPIYAYRCAECGHSKDVLQKISDPVLTDCPACGSAAYTKQLTAAGFQLKGSGWYVTDFRGDKGAATKAEPGADAPAKSDSSDKPADKPADKSSDKPADKAADKAGNGNSADNKPAVSKPPAATPAAAPAASPAKSPSGS